MIFGIDLPARADRLALIDAASGEEWTYRRLREEVERKSRALAAPPALIFQFCENTSEAVAWYLAALEAGHAIALLAGKLDEELRTRIVSRFRPEFILAGFDPGPEYEAVRTGLWRLVEPCAQAPIRAGLALLLSTSGTTGTPKFVRLSRSAVEANAASIAAAVLPFGNR